MCFYNPFSTYRQVNMPEKKLFIKSYIQKQYLKGTHTYSHTEGIKILVSYVYQNAIRTELVWNH